MNFSRTYGKKLSNNDIFRQFFHTSWIDLNSEVGDRRSSCKIPQDYPQHSPGRYQRDPKASHPTSPTALPKCKFQWSLLHPNTCLCPSWRSLVLDPGIIRDSVRRGWFSVVEGGKERCPSSSPINIHWSGSKYPQHLAREWFDVFQLGKNAHIRGIRPCR